jgi:hypothetical protein
VKKISTQMETGSTAKAFKDPSAPNPIDIPPAKDKRDSLKWIRTEPAKGSMTMAGIP